MLFAIYPKAPDISQNYGLVHTSASDNIQTSCVNFVPLGIKVSLSKCKQACKIIYLVLMCQSVF